MFLCVYVFWFCKVMSGIGEMDRFIWKFVKYKYIVYKYIKVKELS